LLLRAGALLILPLCLMGRSMAKLGWSSIFSVISVLAALCCLAAAMACDLDGGHDGVTHRTTPKLLSQGTKLWWLLPLIATFCFANNQVCRIDCRY
jgi:predicted MFS family arabinose efflux permease